MRATRRGRPSGWISESGARERGPWAGRILGALLLVLALVAISQGAPGQQAWRALSGALGAPAPAAPAMRTTAAADTVPPLPGEPTALAAAGEALTAYVGEAEASRWAPAAASLNRLGDHWTVLAPELARHGVPMLQLNTFTTLLADAQARVSDRDRAAALTDARQMVSELGVLTVSWVAREAPTFAELKDLSADLSAALKAGAYARAGDDAADLRMLVNRIGQGF